MTAGTIAASALRSAKAEPGRLTREDTKMADIAHAGAPERPVRKRERWEFLALIAATYPLFLAAALVERASHRGTGATRSVFAEAYATASASLACAFMG